MSNNNFKKLNDLALTLAVSEHIMLSFLVKMNVLNEDLTPSQNSLQKNYVKVINLDGKTELKYSNKCITYIEKKVENNFDFISNQIIFKAMQIFCQIAMWHNKDLTINKYMSEQNVDLKLKFDAIEIRTIYEDNKNKDGFLPALLNNLEQQKVLDMFSIFSFHKDLISLKEKLNLETILPNNTEAIFHSTKKI